MSGDWDTAAEDFGQKVDLTVRIREILRNYPEGLSILKELLQNADDAGARVVRLCTAEARGGNADDPLSQLMGGPSLLAFNSARFTDTDFRSIQRIGDSLKKDAKGTKTGRFGVGFNSTYHLTEVPMFVSGTKIVMFDPQASFVPGINPANPGKLVDFASSKGQALIQRLPNVFDPLQVFGCKFSSDGFDGTTFRFTLRTPEQAQSSRLSRQSHSLESMRAMLAKMASAAPSMLLFLKNVECIEIYDWKASSAEPVMVHRTSLSNPTRDLRKRRSYVLEASIPSLNAPPVPVDYTLDIVSDGLGLVDQGGKAHKLEKWIVCNQLGGGQASEMSHDKNLSHMKLVPWAGVAARVLPPPSATSSDEGAAYCFLPLPVNTRLPVHVNGYFELSSNRRDVWWGDDMAGDGRARAEWNKSLMADVAAVSYGRLVNHAIHQGMVTPETYEYIFPLASATPTSEGSSSSGPVGPWRILASNFMAGIANLPVVYSGALSRWLRPANVVLLHDTKDTKLADILDLEKVPLVRPNNDELRSILLGHGVCSTTTTPAYVRHHLQKQRQGQTSGGALEEASTRIDVAKYLLKHCISDLHSSQYGTLVGCPLVPLASGNLGVFCQLRPLNGSHLEQLQSLGFSKLMCMHALRKTGNSMEDAFDFLDTHRYDDVTISPGMDPYLLFNNVDAAELMKQNAAAAETFVDGAKEDDAALRKFFACPELATMLNIVPLEADMLADIVSRLLPRSWRGADSAQWTGKEPYDVAWFSNLWKYICSTPSTNLSSIAEQFCIVPTNQDLVCSLSPGSSVLDVSTDIAADLVEALTSLGVRTLCQNVLPSANIPKTLWTYIFSPTRDGVIRAVEAAIRREHKPFVSRELLRTFFLNADNGPLTEASQKALRTFPIFKAFVAGTPKAMEEKEGADEASKSAVVIPDTEFVALESKDGAAAFQWVALEGIVDRDKPLMSLSVNIRFLSYDDADEFNLLTRALGVRRVHRGQFYQKFVLPQLTTLDDDMRRRAVETMLVDMSTLNSKTADFERVLADTPIVPSAYSKTLRKASELYDPENRQLRALMDRDAFPDEAFSSPQLVACLRGLGLRTSLSWDTILDCARSIEEEGSMAGKEDCERARIRGKALLAFLDTNCTTFFPELFPEQTEQSMSRGFFTRMVNKALFDDPEKRKREEEEQASRVHILLSTKWMPVHSEAMHPLLPWPDACPTVAAPSETSLVENMWLVSYNRRLVDGSVQVRELKTLFGWLDQVQVKDIATQLKMLSQTYHRIQEEKWKEESEGGEGESRIPLSLEALRQTVTSEVPRLYNVLNNIKTDYELAVMKSILSDTAWLWIGAGFIASDHAAFSSPINAAPYIHTVPPDLACFRNVLVALGVRQRFRSSDYCQVLKRMSEECRTSGSDQLRPLDSAKVELAVNLVQLLSDESMKLKDMEIFAPSTNGTVLPASSMVYDDAPWLNKDLRGTEDLIFAHPKLSAAVSEKLGMKSLRLTLIKDTSNLISFGDGVVHEAFGQSESLTARLKNIIAMYPEGPQQLSELVQNADDAEATVVKFIFSKKQHGTSSLLGQKLGEWQGPALLCFNDAVFTERDFSNISRIGQTTKLEKLSKTGRFGLGFNSVFHWTDVPSIVSGENLVMFDPHAKYVPGATSASRGIKIRFTGSTLVDQFPDQMEPFFHFGCNMKEPFQGTLFRFPFRSDSTAADSEISKAQCGKDGVMDELLENFKNVISKFLLFLRHVRRIEVYYEGPGENDKVELQYYAEVTSREKVVDQQTNPSFDVNNASLGSLRSLVSDTVFRPLNEWNAMHTFIAGSPRNPLSKDAFYSKLMRTPENQLPKSKHLVKIVFVGTTPKSASSSLVRNGSVPDTSKGTETTTSPSDQSQLVDDYLICMGIGGARTCREIACNPENRDMKFIPWAGVAAHLARNGANTARLNGNAFCVLPLPAETGLPVHINGCFELSANRRDIWFGDDMTGEGQLRSEWNRALLTEVIAPMYGQLLLEASRILGAGQRYNQLWPIDASSAVWQLVRNSLYKVIQGVPILYSPLNDGIWLPPNAATVIDAVDSTDGKDSKETEQSKRLMKILLTERMSIVSIPASIINCLIEAKCGSVHVNSAVVRTWFKRPRHHPSLDSQDDALFVLKYCLTDLIETRQFHELNGLPLIPLSSGELGVFQSESQGSEMNYFVTNKTERDLLSRAGEKIVNIWTPDESLNLLLRNEDLLAQTNVSRVDASTFVSLLSYCFPPEWSGHDEVRWDPERKESTVSTEWISNLWDYIASPADEDQQVAIRDVQVLVDTWPMLPSQVTDNDKTLLKLSERLPLISLTDLSSGAQLVPDDVATVMREVGVRTLDMSSFDESNKRSILRKLEGIVQPPSIHGFLTALANSLPADASGSEVTSRLDSRFRAVPSAGKDKIREFFSDARYLEGAKGSSFTDGEIKLVRALPIYRTYGEASLGNDVFYNLEEERYLPPHGTDPNLLDKRFLRADNRKDVELYETLGITRVSPSFFYEAYVCAEVASGGFQDSVRDKAVLKILQELPLLRDEEGEEWIERMKEQEFVPNRNGDPMRAKDLYDPEHSELQGLLDEALLPAEKFCSSGSLSSLRVLGMRTKLTGDGVLTIAKGIEKAALSNERNAKEVLEKAQKLLSHLDDDETVASLVGNVETLQYVVSSDGADEVERRESEAAPFIAELLRIAWLPVEGTSGPDDGDTPKPPCRESRLSVVSEPLNTRPKSDEWLCSSTMGILSRDLRSEALKKCFGWDKPVPVSAVARQVVALADMNVSVVETRSLRLKLATVLPQCYERLNDHLASGASSDGSLDELKERRWLWVGDRFVSPNQVAFIAPENARPFLFSVPEDLKCFDSLLRHCGVREKFGAEDFVELLRSLNLQLNGAAATPEQLDLAVFVAKHLSRLPESEVAQLERKKIYLPSKQRKMHRIDEMMYDDAPWLSSRLTGTLRSRSIFVHPDVGIDIAQLLGAKSLRDVLSGDQSGMVKIPCPKGDKFAQLFSSRENTKQEDCRAILELLEVGEMNGAKQVSIVVDRRTHDSMSLVHPCLAPAQGPAIVVCFHDVVMTVDQIVTLISPSKHLTASVSGEHGCGGEGFPRYGRGLCSSFHLADCLQILVGGSMIFLDPNGEYFVEGANPSGSNSDATVEESSGSSPPNQDQPAPQRRRNGKPTARNYGINPSFTSQFPDQFAPFFSLPLGVKEAFGSDVDMANHERPVFRGTILRLPLRSADGPPSAISQRTLSDDDVTALISELERRIPLSFLFTYNLQGVSLSEWGESEKAISRVVQAQVSSSPVLRWNHLDDMRNNKDWRKDGNKLAKLVFKSTWATKLSSILLEVTHTHREDIEPYVDSFLVTSALAPPKLREMACTEALKPLKLIPAAMLAAHVGSKKGRKTISANDYKLTRGTVFVGLDTGIPTGLPFFLNLPLFLHELNGGVLLKKEDDNDFKKLFPGYRNVQVKVKTGGTELRSLALHVWCRQCVSSAFTELVPFTIKRILESQTHALSRNPRTLYKFWPYYQRMVPNFREIMPPTVYADLAKPAMPIYLADSGGARSVRDSFQSSSDGCFAAPEFPVVDSLPGFFRNRVSLFTVPRLVVEDLRRFDVKIEVVTPSFARKVLKQVQHSQWLMHQPSEAGAILEFCLGDAMGVENFERLSPEATQLKRELSGLCLMPLADGTVGTIGSQMIVASAEQRELLPSLKGKFVCSSVEKRLERYFSKPGFTDFLGLSEFGPKILARDIATVLPSTWKGKEFVKWNGANDSTEAGPSRRWVFQFWKEVHIWDHEAVQLFRRWPLIPTTSGELASCGNARFILCLNANVTNTELRDAISADYASMQTQLEADMKRELLRRAAEGRTETGENGSRDDEFWSMGQDDNDDDDGGNGHVFDEEAAAMEDLETELEDSGAAEEESSSARQDLESRQAPSDHEEQAEEGAARANETVNENDDDRDADEVATSNQDLNALLVKMRYPLLEAAFFSEQDVAKTVPRDQLTVTRRVLEALLQCIDYWGRDGSSEEPKLVWENLDSECYDELLTLLTKHQGSRLSLMPSDLSMVRKLPIFETLSGSRVPLAEGEQNYSLDSAVEGQNLTRYLPWSLKSRFLATKPIVADVYHDLGIKKLDEATLMKDFILPEFSTMPLTQKETVCQTILEKWGELGSKREFVDVLKSTPFVKRANETRDSSDIVFVLPEQLLDPRNDFLKSMFNDSSGSFPAEEFERDEWLVILSELGMKNDVDKDTFLKCAWKVEAEESTAKGLKLLRFFKENFANFLDQSQDFSRKLADIRCVPAEMDSSQLGLYKFSDIAVPRDRHIAFKVLPVIPDSACPPQVLFSSLGVVSPPSIGTVLKHVRELTEDGGGLDHWDYKYGSVEEVFIEVFSFLQENFDRISPRIQAALCDRAIVPVGTSLVKANRLFFRLARDLAPFFYEVPRAFGAYDRLLRKLGVRDSPTSDDYAISLSELKNELGESRLNANELKSVIEIVTLIASEGSLGVASGSPPPLFVPDRSGRLVSTDSMVQNDCPWLVLGGRLDLDLVHLCHPKMPQDLCNELGIAVLSDQVREVLENRDRMEEVREHDTGLLRIQHLLRNEDFIPVVEGMLDLRRRSSTLAILRNARVARVRGLRTRFVFTDRDGSMRDITKDATGCYCFIDGSSIFVAPLPSGLTDELVIATTLCDSFGIERRYAAALSAMLASDDSNMDVIKRTMGVSGAEDQDELHRGEPGAQLAGADTDLVTLKPLKMYSKGEIVAVRVGDSEPPPSDVEDAVVENDGQNSELVYGVVVQGGGGTSLSRLRIRVGNGKEVDFLSSQVYCLRGGASSGSDGQSAQDRSGSSNARSIPPTTTGLLRPTSESSTNNDRGSDAGSQAISQAVAPVERHEVLRAVQDLLSSANLSLEDDVKNVLESNLSLKEDLKHKDVYISSLVEEGRSLASDLGKGWEGFLCPITREIMSDPVICADGHTYERSAIEEWLRSSLLGSPRSPKTNEPLASRVLIPNHAMRATIEAMTENMEAVQKFTDAFN